jgi:hypothetical protein
MDPVTGAAAFSAWLESMAAAAAVAAPEVAAGAAAAGAGAEALAAMSPLAMEAGGGMVGALSPVALEQGGGALLSGSVAPGMMDKFGAMLAKNGPKLAGQVGADMMNDPAPKPQMGSSRMPGSQQQATTTEPFDYGGAAVQPVGAAERLNISDEELKRLLMSLRGY